MNHLSGREIAESCGDCSKTTVNEFLKRFKECPELTYPLSEDVTNEYIAGLLYKKSGIAADQLLYRDFNKEAVYKTLARRVDIGLYPISRYNRRIDAGYLHFCPINGNFTLVMNITSRKMYKTKRPPMYISAVKKATYPEMFICVGRK